MSLKIYESIVDQNSNNICWMKSELNVNKTVEEVHIF